MAASKLMYVLVQEHLDCPGTQIYIVAARNEAEVK